ncbi:MAG: RNA polymerase factor sigma-54 [Bacteroidales bacterium]|nr:RNA polymerase factor sigma-54 [Bacteroidales bacterium]
MLSQQLQQKLLQKLSPQQIQLMKLLQVPTTAMEQRIKQEIEENPALEEYSDDPNEESLEEQYDKEDQADEFDVNDYLDDDEIPSYRYNASNNSGEDENKQIPYAAGITFREQLEDQLALYALNDREFMIASMIIGNLDDSGYLKRSTDAMVDDFAFTRNMEVKKPEIEKMLGIVQSMDPPGTGARTLQECLCLQLKRKDRNKDSIQHALGIIDRFFNEFTKKHYNKIIKRYGITEEELKNAIEEILKLNPKPGNTMGQTDKPNHYVIPDFIITIDNGELNLQLNHRNMPELRVSQTYQNMLRAYSEQKMKKSKKDKDAIMFVKQKIDSAKWFIDAIKQRQNTLYVTMEAIMNYQREYFLEGDETKLHPMILKDIAEIVNLDISTISRVANSKYVQTPFGTFLLKSFFSESMQTQSGESVSTREVKKILQDFIESEDKKKPITDEHLSKLLKEKGYNIARRTVAKYREQLNIPVARLRKEI